ncbi:MAG TPA: thiamine pyrophosphate-dependent enzyme [Thermodesulfovibrio thiophilus]|uniref:thiamine pyrophosphate-dependent enzyme n=1 Tax=Thermodesulfovibrio thiophilus TaxID=340095 RepID=UPI00182EF402|nr:thiamine pyrophosphate-dependent enzyme [Thermodesulfovibrio thiophilus]HHW19670.1 2-oxoglutarate oxidoreductase [Thermodesulfovibrio thiophilus]HOA83139.1 thiamine pyrophosphate-dependent enzyme [Thermodesulfovibrio thiophilus]HQA03776.1 thiamine pyrophosphate-dependent enzyme [Thermodesulfovibrio thiophilus]HQD36375.1 thiamine pyrophosphate-dependent enzyme [Thermodesulfovibrio thiophilus]
MKKIFSKPQSLKNVAFKYCPGCGHSIAHRLIGEVIDELQIREITIGIAPVGCAVFAYNYFDIDMLEIPHGRPPAAATGMKRVYPDKVIFAYQGDGDLAAIGTAEIIHAANRGENITIFFINNANYGMTGGQMAPTTLKGQRTTTTPLGRDPKVAGYPIHVSELLSHFEGTAFIARGSLDSYKNIVITKKYIKKALQYQIDNKGFSFVEMLCPCPTDWGMSPEEALKWLRENMMSEFKLGEIKDKWSNV